MGEKQPNLYKLLGVNPSATVDEIRRAFYRQQLHHHPDRGGSVHKSQKLNEAYQALANDQSRRDYDKKLDENDKLHDSDDDEESSTPKLTAKRISEGLKIFFEIFVAIGQSKTFVDNFFPFYTEVLSKIQVPPYLASAYDENNLFQCATCGSDGRYLNEDEHFDIIIKPYLEQFAFEPGKEKNITEYLKDLIGEDAFDWTLAEYPGVLECWTATDWNKFSIHSKAVQDLFRFLHDSVTAKSSLTLEQIDEFIQDRFKFSAGDELTQILEFCLNNSNLPEILKLLSSLAEIYETTGKALDHLLLAAAFLQVFLNFNTAGDWNTLGFVLLSDGHPSNLLPLAMVSIKIASILAEGEDKWYELGLKIVEEDLQRAYVCFILGSCDLEQVGQTLKKKGNHKAALYYYSNKLGNMFEVWKICEELKEENKFQDAFHTAICVLVKFLLKENKIEEVIKLLAECFPVGVFLRLCKSVLVSFPEKFVRAELIHIKMLEKLQLELPLEDASGKCKILDFIDAAVHFLPPNSKYNSKWISELRESTYFELLYSTLYKKDAVALATILAHAKSLGAAKKLLKLQVEQYKNLESTSPFYWSLILLIKGAIQCHEGKGKDAARTFQKAAEGNPDIMEGIVEFYKNPRLHFQALKDAYQDLSRLKHQIENNIYPELGSGADGIFMETYPSQKCQFNPILSRYSFLRAVSNGEKLISENLETRPAELAYAYADLAMHGLTATTNIGIQLNVISNFLREMQLQLDHLPRVYAYSMLISVTSEKILRQVAKIGNPAIKAYATNALWCLLFQSDQIFSKAIRQFNESNSSGPSSSSDGAKADNEIFVPDKEEIFQTVRARILQFALNYQNIFPIMTSRFYTSLDLNIYESRGRKFLQHFLEHKAEHKLQRELALLPSFVYDYFRFDGFWREWLDGGNKNQESGKAKNDKKVAQTFDKFRLYSMISLAETQGWDIREVENLLIWPILRRDGSGWLNTNDRSLNFEGQESFSSFRGVQINETTGQISFLLDKSPELPKLFSWADIIEIFEKEIEIASFTLDQPTTGRLVPPYHDLPMTSHPFQEAIVFPKNLCGTNYKATLFHADYYLKFFTVGTEVCARIPFQLRPTSEGLLRNISPTLQKVLLPITERKKLGNLTSDEKGHRFWLKMKNVDWKVSIVEKNVERYEIGSVTAILCTKELDHNPQTGQLGDKFDGDEEDEDSLESNLSPEKEFVRDFNLHFETIAQTFPIFQRTKELMKISTAFRLLNRFFFGTELKSLEECKANEVKMLDGLRPKFSECYYPNVEARVDTLVAGTGAKSRAEVDPTSIVNARRDINNNNAQVINSLAEALSQTASIPVESLIYWIPPYLTGDPGALDSLANSIAQGKRAVYEANRNRTLAARDAIKALKTVPDTSKCPGDPCNCCNWVPAAFCKRIVTEKQRDQHETMLAKMAGKTKTQPVIRRQEVNAAGAQSLEFGLSQIEGDSQVGDIVPTEVGGTPGSKQGIPTGVKDGAYPDLEVKDDNPDNKSKVPSDDKDEPSDGATGDKTDENVGAAKAENAKKSKRVKYLENYRVYGGIQMMPTLTKSDLICSSPFTVFNYDALNFEAKQLIDKSKYGHSSNLFENHHPFCRNSESSYSFTKTVYFSKDGFRSTESASISAESSCSTFCTCSCRSDRTFGFSTNIFNNSHTSAFSSSTFNGWMSAPICPIVNNSIFLPQTIFPSKTEISSTPDTFRPDTAQQVPAPIGGLCVDPVQQFLRKLPSKPSNECMNSSILSLPLLNNGLCAQNPPRVPSQTGIKLSDNTFGSLRNLLGSREPHSPLNQSCVPYLVCTHPYFQGQGSVPKVTDPGLLRAYNKAENVVMSYLKRTYVKAKEDVRQDAIGSGNKPFLKRVTDVRDEFLYKVVPSLLDPNPTQLWKSSFGVLITSYGELIGWGTETANQFLAKVAPDAKTLQKAGFAMIGDGVVTAGRFAFDFLPNELQTTIQAGVLGVADFLAPHYNELTDGQKTIMQIGVAAGVTKALTFIPTPGKFKAKEIKLSKPQESLKTKFFEEFTEHGGASNSVLKHLPEGTPVLVYKKNARGEWSAYFDDSTKRANQNHHLIMKKYKDRNAVKFSGIDIVDDHKNLLAMWGEDGWNLAKKRSEAINEAYAKALKSKYLGITDAEIGELTKLKYPKSSMIKHSGSHSGKYMEIIENKLSDLEMKIDAGSVGKEKVREELYEFMQHLRDGIRSNKILINEID